MVELITRTSTDLPPDVRAAMGLALRQEEPATRAGQALTIIAQNIDQATVVRRADLPGHRHADLRGARSRSARIRSGCGSRSARRSPKRPGAASCGRTRSTRSPARTPATTSARARRSSTSSSGRSRTSRCKLILKGGGCENTNAQYALPAELDHLGRADRTLEGVRKCILHAVWKAQGKGCSPGAVGVCVGGDRTSGYLHAKEQLFRTLDDTNPDPRLAALEDVDHGRGEPADRRADGVRRQDVADRLQDRRAQPPAGELLRLGRLRLLGLPPPRRAARRATGAITVVAVSRRRRRRRSRCWRRKPSPPGSRAPAARSRCRRRSPKSRSARSRSATSC